MLNVGVAHIRCVWVGYKSDLSEFSELAVFLTTVELCNRLDNIGDEYFRSLH